MKDDTITLSIRLPKTLHRKAKKLAKRERRSFNKQIEILVEKWEQETKARSVQAVTA